MIEAFIKALKEHLAGTVPSYLHRDSYGGGNFEDGFHTVVEFDLTALQDEIDAFAAKFKEKP